MHNFFGSKLNTVLIVVLIMSVIFISWIVWQARESTMVEITLEGKRKCLSSPTLQIQPCFPGFETTDGKEYYLEANGFYFSNSLKDPVVVRGLLVPRNNSEHKKTYKDFDIEGVVKVIDVKNAD